VNSQREEKLRGGCTMPRNFNSGIYITTENRRAALRALLKSKKCLRVLEAHSPISALLAQNTKLVEASGQEVRYDAFWSSSLTDSTERGRPDIEILDIANRLHNINDIFEVTNLPMVIDGDTGGKTEHFAINVRTLERVGVSAVVIEDKRGLKKNSLFGNEVYQEQEAIDEFCEKIRAGKAAQVTDDFMIIARIESLILDAGMDDALTRAFAYAKAGADGIMIHSRKQEPAEVFEFVNSFRLVRPEIPLVCVPTSYSRTHFNDLEDGGFNMVIYANHMLRSAYMAMQSVASDILRYGRTHEVEPACLGVNEILNLIPGTR
jgi:phosphoenolpyruvate phosphomutase